MSITNIATLQDAAELWAERTYADALFLEWANAVADKLMHGLMGPDNRTWISPPLRCGAMHATDTLNASGGSVALPADWLEGVRIWIDASDGRDLLYYPLRQFRSQALAQLSGTPSVYTIDGATLYVAPTSAADLEVSYFTTLGGFTGDSDTDAVLSAHPGVYLSGVLGEAYRWARDGDGAGMETAEMAAKVRALNAEFARGQTSGSIMVARPQGVA